MGKITTKEEASTPQTPASTMRSLYPKADGWYEIDDQGLETKLFSSSVFGVGFKEQAKATVETRSSNVYGNYLTMAHPTTMVGAKYRIGVTVGWNYSSTSRKIYIELRHSGVRLGELVMETKDSSSLITNWTTSFFYFTETVAGTHDIEINYRCQSNSDTATVFYAGLEFWRVE